MPQSEYGKQFVTVLEHICSSINHIQAGEFSLAEKEVLKALQLEPEYSVCLYLYSVCLDEKGMDSAKVYRQQSYYLNVLFFQHFNFKQDQILKNIQNKSRHLINKIKKDSVTTSTCIQLVHQTKDYNTFSKMAKIYLEGANYQNSKVSKMLFMMLLTQSGQTEIVYNQIHNRHKGLQNILPMRQQIIISITFELQKYEECFESIKKSQKKSPNSFKPCVMRSKIFYQLNKSKEALEALQLEGKDKSGKNMYHILQAIIVLLRFFPGEKDEIQKYLEEGKQIVDSHWWRERLILKWINNNFDNINQNNKCWVQILNKISHSIYSEKLKKEKLYTDISILVKQLGLQPLRITAQFLCTQKPALQQREDDQVSQVSQISEVGSAFDLDDDSLIVNTLEDH